MKEQPKEPEHLTPEKVDQDAVARVAAQVQLHDIRTGLLHAVLNADVREVPLGWGDQAQIVFDGHSGAWEPGDTAFTAFTFFSLTFSLNEDEDADAKTSSEGGPPDIEVTAGFELDYSLRDPSEITDRDLEHFCYQNAVFNCWPYWRETAHVSTRRMGIAPFVVPVKTVTPIIVSPPAAKTSKKKSASRKSQST